MPDNIESILNDYTLKDFSEKYSNPHEVNTTKEMFSAEAQILRKLDLNQNFVYSLKEKIKLNENKITLMIEKHQIKLDQLLNKSLRSIIYIDEQLLSKKEIQFLYELRTINLIDKFEQEKIQNSVIENRKLRNTVSGFYFVLALTLISLLIGSKIAHDIEKSYY